MTALEKCVRNALEDNGIALSNWRVELRVLERGYQFDMIEIKVYQPRHRKPSTVWAAPYDSFRQLLHWEYADLLDHREFKY